MAAGRPYVAIFSGLTSLTAVPFLQIAAPAGTGLEIVTFELGQETSETSQQEVVTAQRRTTASTLPTTVTPSKLQPGDPAAIATVHSGIATGTGTAGDVVGRWSFNVLNGLLYVPVPEERIIIAPGGWLTFQFPTAPAANTWSGRLVFREMA
jgi:hypothetical protein